MAEIGVERLGPGDREKDGAEGEESDDAVTGEEADPVERVEGGKHPRIVEMWTRPRTQWR